MRFFILLISAIFFAYSTQAFENKFQRVDKANNMKKANIIVGYTNMISNDKIKTLNNELTKYKKISNYVSDKKVISLKEISALTNLSENYSANELVDASLSKNIKKTQEILDESNYSQEDTFLILRVFLQKAKKILNLTQGINNGRDIEKVIAEHKPPIFWKDKPVIKKQIQMWSFESINELIYKLNNVELEIKKNNTLSLVLMKNFIYEMLD